MSKATINELVLREWNHFEHRISYSSTPPTSYEIFLGGARAMFKVLKNKKKRERKAAKK